MRQSALGTKFRRLRGRLGAPKRITAMAHRLAPLSPRTLKFGAAYVDKAIERYEAKIPTEASSTKLVFASLVDTGR
jgi:hypothetical protein